LKEMGGSTTSVGPPIEIDSGPYIDARTNKPVPCDSGSSTSGDTDPESTEGSRWQWEREQQRRDECKAIVPDGVDLVLDFNKDLVLGGIFTISIKNKIFVNSPPTSAKQSLP